MNNEEDVTGLAEWTPQPEDEISYLSRDDLIDEIDTLKTALREARQDIVDLESRLQALNDLEEGRL